MTSKDDLSLILQEIHKVDEKIQKLDDKINYVKEDISNIELNVAKNANSLEHHMQRTHLNEENIKLLKLYIDEKNHNLEERLKPINKWFDSFGVMAKIFGFIAGGVTFLVGLSQALKYLLIYFK